jgi:hypothetical protein
MKISAARGLALGFTPYRNIHYVGLGFLCPSPYRIKSLPNIDFSERRETVPSEKSTFGNSKL